jgi:hypothetical protein
MPTIADGQRRTTLALNFGMTYGRPLGVYPTHVRRPGTGHRLGIVLKREESGERLQPQRRAVVGGKRCCTGCNRAPVSSPAAAPAVSVPLRVKMRNSGVARITVVSAVRTAAITTTAFASAPRNGGFLLLDVLWEAEAGKTTCNPLYFSAKGCGGRRGRFEKG